VRYCEHCGTKLDFDLFSSEPQASYVFVDKPWYPERLSCYATDEEPVECVRCGESAPAATLHGSVRLTEHDFRSRHISERTSEDHHGELCPKCLKVLAEDLGLKDDSLIHDTGETSEVELPLGGEL